MCGPNGILKEIDAPKQFRHLFLFMGYPQKLLYQLREMSNIVDMCSKFAAMKLDRVKLYSLKSDVSK